MKTPMQKISNIYIVQVFGDNGSWYDVVKAETEDEAIKKITEVYKEFHKALKIEIKDNYDYFIE